MKEPPGAPNTVAGPLTIWARYFRDENTGALRLEKVSDPAQVKRDDPNFVAVGAITVRVFPAPVAITSRPLRFLLVKCSAIRVIARVW